ncbi:hypothetical protein PMZ80_005942 [Knufia obscura]|uniref:Uncharacterized protein n=1 Tax=Knufia obscura TaxID=1635080 RepID=A0ABR0RN16_9EURO|nr:hypothetical protein PMZ80_005942 [Knufia obscura]
MSFPQPAMTEEEIQRRARVAPAFKHSRYMNPQELGTSGGHQPQSVNPRELAMSSPATVDMQHLQIAQPPTPGARQVQNQQPRMSSSHVSQLTTRNVNSGARQLQDRPPQMPLNAQQQQVTEQYSPSGAHQVQYRPQQTRQQMSRHVTPGARQVQNRPPQTLPHTQQQMTQNVSSGASQVQDRPPQMPQQAQQQQVTAQYGHLGGRQVQHGAQQAQHQMPRDATPGARQAQSRPVQMPQQAQLQQVTAQYGPPGAHQVQARPPQMIPSPQQQMGAQYLSMWNPGPQAPRSQQQIARTATPGVRQPPVPQQQPVSQAQPPQMAPFAPQQIARTATSGAHQSPNLNQPRPQHLQQQNAQPAPSTAHQSSMPTPQSPSQTPIRYLTRAQYLAEKRRVVQQLGIQQDQRGPFLAYKGHRLSVIFSETRRAFAVEWNGGWQLLHALRGGIEIVEEGDPRAGRVVAVAAGASQVDHLGQRVNNGVPVVAGGSGPPGTRPIAPPGQTVTGNIAAAVRQSTPTPAPGADMGPPMPARGTSVPRNPTLVSSPMPPPQWAPTTTASSSHSPPSEPSPGSRKRNAEGQLKNSSPRAQIQPQPPQALQPQRVSTAQSSQPAMSHPTGPAPSPARAHGPTPGAARAPAPAPASIQAPSPIPGPSPTSAPAAPVPPQAESPEALRRRQTIRVFRSLPRDEQRLVAACAKVVAEGSGKTPEEYLYDRWFGPATELVDAGLSEQKQTPVWRQDGTQLPFGTSLSHVDNADGEQARNEMRGPDELGSSTVRIPTPPPLDFEAIDAAIEELGCWAELGSLVGGLLDEVWFVCQGQNQNQN